MILTDAFLNPQRHALVQSMILNTLPAPQTLL